MHQWLWKVQKKTHNIIPFSLSIYISVLLPLLCSQNRETLEINWTKHDPWHWLGLQHPLPTFHLTFQHPTGHWPLAQHTLRMVLKRDSLESSFPWPFSSPSLPPTPSHQGQSQKQRATHRSLPLKFQLLKQYHKEHFYLCISHNNSVYIISCDCIYIYMMQPHVSKTKYIISVVRYTFFRDASEVLFCHRI